MHCGISNTSNMHCPLLEEQRWDDYDYVDDAEDEDTDDGGVDGDDDDDGGSENERTWVKFG